MGHYFGCVGVGETLFWVGGGEWGIMLVRVVLGGALFWVGESGWG